MELTVRFGKAAARPTVGELRVTDITGQNRPRASESCEPCGNKKSRLVKRLLQEWAVWGRPDPLGEHSRNLSLVTVGEPRLSQETRQTFATSAPSHPGSQNASGQAFHGPDRSLSQLTGQ